MQKTVRFKLNTIIRTSLLCLLAAACTLWPGAPACCAQPREAPEYQLKAAFLYNLLQFIEWPEQAFKDAASPLVICVYDDKAAGSAFDSYRNEKIRGRQLVFKRYDDIQTSLECHILFINTQDKKALGDIAAKAAGRSILTVGEADECTRLGCIINFFTADNKLRFEINPEAAKKAGLKLSSEILKVARIVAEK